ncbi:aminopeptidase [Cordyceps fumosorosea ARSEF 2679]|uniref:Aminopeptidase n=1 Tax=Cordyceps fumosorosea (strain ARSEF 2679) TaxID=1081104 RepID=A0A167YDB0_CORFA|nr:aminopeptidase [Cordyceps fumosorosea ARSEF 2679]OAA66199.1 aminopeptidase [Cordyceps fumosorosea ARSEF 2679]
MCRAAESLATAARNVPERDLLPANVIPRHYQLELEPDFDKFTFNGKVVIDLDVAEESNYITLHSLEISILGAKVTSEDKEFGEDIKVTQDEARQTTTVSFAEKLSEGSKAQLELTFLGQLNNKMVGFYRSGYAKTDGTKGFIATTQMEPTGARQAFPCFDEPALKAAFDITLVAEKHLTCLSNMPVKSEAEVYSSISNGTRKAVKFDTSPTMSTYLTAFIIGELNYVESNLFRIPVRTYVTIDQNVEYGRHAADLGARTLELFEKEFGVEFPLPKMDQIAVLDFAEGAMENWGLITYRAVDLLVEDNAGAGRKRRVTDIVLHELAHQWFGNLVTMEWWEGLWLKEGFATWASLYGANVFYPEWNIWADFVISSLQDALHLDSLRSSHPIEVPVKSANEINQIFDAISYEKGCSVLRMISVHIGEDVFLKGIRDYLKKFAYKNTTTDDLWNCLSEASGKPVTEVIAPWTREIGYPVLSVSEDSATKKITVQQNRFLRTGDVTAEDDKILYPVILGLRTEAGVDRTTVMTGRETTLSVSAGSFFKLNADHPSVYRTLYSPEILARLAEAARAGTLSIADRTGLVADAAALTAAGYMKTSTFLTLAQSLKDETSFFVWKELLVGLGAMSTAWMFQDEAVTEGLKAFRKELVTPIVRKLGYEIHEADGHVDQQLKDMIMRSAAMCGDEETIKAAQNAFEKSLKGELSALHPTLRTTVYAITSRYGGEVEMNQLLDRYRTSSVSDERISALRGCGFSNDPQVIKQVLAAMDNSEAIKDQDVYIPIGGIRSSRTGADAAWKHFLANWDTFYERFPPGLSMLKNLVKFFCEGMGTPEQLSQFKAFFEGKDIRGVDNSVRQVIDSVQAKLSWVERDSDDVVAWLKGNGYMHVVVVGRALASPSEATFAPRMLVIDFNKAGGAAPSSAGAASRGIRTDTTATENTCRDQKNPVKVGGFSSAVPVPNRAASQVSRYREWNVSGLMSSVSASPNKAARSDVLQGDPAAATTLPMIRHRKRNTEYLRTDDSNSK